MENVLMLTYYYPPCRGVASYRPKSWAKDFQQNGLNPTFITRHWNGEENAWEDYLKDCISEIKITTDKTSTTISLPYKKNGYVLFAEKKWVKSLFLDKVIYFFQAITGNFQMDVDAYHCFEKYLFNHLETKTYKLIVVTTPPLNAVKLAYEVNKKFKIPFVVDFQDSWNNLMLVDNYNPGIKEKFYNSLKEFYLRKWLKPVLFTGTVTPLISDFIKKVSNKPIEIITNGFEKDAYQSKNIKPSTSFFNISLMGTIHPMQDISMMLKGINLFLRNKDSNKIKLNFIGVDAIPEMADKVKASIPKDFLYTSSRFNMDKAIDLTLAADVLLFPSYKGYKGYYTAKIFEYLGAERNILMVPGNNDIVDDLIQKTQAGKIANSENEFANILNNWYMEWQTNGALTYNGIKENINFFSRENQNKLLCKAIKRELIAAK